jgi:CPA1 family monovalent cation:H+ antiporter
VTERAIWRSVQFMLESVIFLLIGLQLRTLVDKAAASSTDNGQILRFCIAIVAVVIVVRILWVFPTTYLPRLLPAVRRADAAPSWQALALLSWAGMRGVVTIAAAFTLTGIPGNETLIIAAFAVVVASLLIQGATLPWLVRVLKVRGPDEAQDALQQALVLQRAVDAGRARLEELSDSAPKQVVKSLEAWGERLTNAVWERLGSPSGETPTRAFRRLRVAMLDAERRVVVDVRRSGAVAPEVLEGVLERLDQEEAMLSAFAEATAVSDVVLTPPNDPGACDHLRHEPLVAVPTTTPDECAECVAIGKDDWVSLRMCLHCGNVACCDSSPRRHADAHFRETTHPVMRSVELGEAWRWCYVDRQVG